MALNSIITWQLYASFRHRCNLSVLLHSWSYYGPQLFTCPCSFSCSPTPFLFSCFVEHSVVLGNIQNNYIQIYNRWMCELYYGHHLFTCPFSFSCFPTPFYFHVLWNIQIQINTLKFLVDSYRIYEIDTYKLLVDTCRTYEKWTCKIDTY